MKAAVSQPRSCRMLARVGVDGERTNPPVSRTLWRRRIEPGEDAGVGRRSQRGLGYAILKQNAALRDAIERGSFDFVVAIAVQMIGTKRVDGDDDDVERAQSCGAAGRGRWQETIAPRANRAQHIALAGKKTRSAASNSGYIATKE